MLRAESVSKRYGKVTALDGASIEIEAGRVTAVIGANGAGKTTLIKCIVGLLKFEGRIAINGVDISRHGKAARRLVGYLPQNPAFHADLSVAETALFYGGLKGVPASRAREMVETAGLEAHADKTVGALSGGMRQRLALGVALLADPPLLILDEPAAGLDISARLELRRLVGEQRQAGKAILLSTHWLEDVPYVADEALVLDHGKTVFQGPATQLATSGAPGSRLYLRLNGHSPDAIPLLQGMTSTGSVDRSGDWVVVTCPAADKARVVEALVDAGIGILDFRVEEAPVDAAVLRLQATHGGEL
ncbi:MAG: ABC transporter ATP-binding protein [Chloroflexi bacterium]|nr:ABC transporter ATP-binding protein [Chloroflexota bacterium]